MKFVFDLDGIISFNSDDIEKVKEMSSKLMNGLYFCGEILDIHDYTARYNITSALVTGRIAGITAVQNATI